jgi:glucose/arabinose dehydrogenase
MIKCTKLIRFCRHRISIIIYLALFFNYTLFSSTEAGQNEIYRVTDSENTSQSVLPRIVGDQDLQVQKVLSGINVTSNMAFLGIDDLLILEKNEGTIKRIVNSSMHPQPMLDLNVVHSDGLLGIAISEGRVSQKNVFVYYTEAPKKYGQDVNDEREIKVVNSSLGYIRECNCLYRYELVNGKLQNQKLLLSLPAGPGGQHHGGEILIGPDNNMYIAVGNIEGQKNSSTRTRAQNFDEDVRPDGRAGILRITQDGNPVGNGLLGNDSPLDLYYAYGIRNSFGMDFDPVTGSLWDTENGPDHGDEINLVEPGFNSGAEAVFGFDNFDSNELVDFDNKGKYSEPEFVWNVPVGPTAIKFLNSTKYGEEYENDLFVGDINNGNLYHFELNEERTGLELEGELEDKIANNQDELEPVIFGTGFGGITDIQVGPDGYLYVLANGSIFRIIPTVKSLENI